MNEKDRQNLEVILYRLDEQDKLRDKLATDVNKSLDAMRSSMDSAHTKTSADLKFIKENLFNPNEGLWAESKKNTSFRENTSKALWVFIPTSIASAIKIIWDSFKG